MNTIFRGCLGLCLLVTSSLLWAKDKIVIFAAASLTNAMEQIAADYEKQHDVDCVFSFASSSTLAKQIQHGAPADVFISANTQWMDYLAKHDQIEPETTVNLLHNSLVLVTAKNSPLAQQSLTLNKQATRDWKSWLNGGKLAVGDPDYVPAGMYAKEALSYLGDFDQLASQMARANNVRSALVLVERQEAPLGIVYYSDTYASPAIQIIGTFPAESHAPIVYPMAITRHHANPAVRAFYEHLQSDAALAIFKQNGFQIDATH